MTNCGDSPIDWELFQKVDQHLIDQGFDEWVSFVVAMAAAKRENVSLLWATRAAARLQDSLIPKTIPLHENIKDDTDLQYDLIALEELWGDYPISLEEALEIEPDDPRYKGVRQRLYRLRKELEDDNESSN